MNFRRIRVMYFKELLDTFRDKRTLIASIAMPTIIYPALFIFGSQALVIQQTNVQQTESTVAVTPAGESVVEEWVGAIENVTIEAVEDPAAALERGDIDAVVAVTSGSQDALAEGGTVELEIRYDATEMRSREAANRLSEGLQTPREDILLRRLEAKGLDRAYITPIDISEENVAPPAKTAGSILGGVLPILMVVMLGLGAFYPAVDLTAGEKERGTFETLLSTPTAKLEMVSSKFLAVFTLSMLTGLLNLGSMALTLAVQLSQLSGQLGNLEVRLSPGVIATMFLVMIPLSFFVSAVMMAIAVCARNFREAQNFVTPFFLVIIFPATLAAVPGTELTATMALVPIANASLLFKELLTAAVPPQTVFAVFVSTAAYAGLGLIVATWLFQREDVLLAEDKGIPLSIRRSDFKPRSAPTAGLAIGLYLVTMLLIFYVGSSIQARALFPGLLITEWILILLPTLLVLAYTRIDLRSALNLHRPSFPALGAAVVMGLGWVVLIIQFSIWFNEIFPMSEEMARQLGEVLEAEAGAYAWWVSILVIAASPAICEEVLFRGALLSAFRRSLPAWATILLVGLLFGVFHLSFYRIIPTGLSGVVLTYVALRSGSIYLAMLIHFMNNAAGILLMNPAVQSYLERFIDLSAIETEGLPVVVLIGGGVLFVAGAFLLHKATRRTE